MIVAARNSLSGTLICSCTEAAILVCWEEMGLHKHVLYLVLTGKNRPYSQGKWWRPRSVCIINHNSASPRHRRRHCVGREHQWSPWQHTQCDAGKGNWKKEGSDWLETAGNLCRGDVWVVKRKKCGGGGLHSAAVRAQMCMHAHTHFSKPVSMADNLAWRGDDMIFHGPCTLTSEAGKNRISFLTNAIRVIMHTYIFEEKHAQPPIPLCNMNSTYYPVSFGFKC